MEASRNMLAWSAKVSFYFRQGNWAKIHDRFQFDRFLLLLLLRLLPPPLLLL